MRIGLAIEHGTVGGYKTWRLRFSLHPTIETDGPLEFDIVGV